MFAGASMSVQDGIFPDPVCQPQGRKVRVLPEPQDQRDLGCSPLVGTSPVADVRWPPRCGVLFCCFMDQECETVLLGLFVSLQERWATNVCHRASGSHAPNNTELRPWTNGYNAVK